MKSKTLIISAAIAVVSLGALGLQQAYAHGSFGGHGGGYNMGAGMGMGSGMGPGMGRGMMNGNMGGQGCPNGQVQALAQPLTVDDVRTNMEQHLKWSGNDRLKVGQVTELDDKFIVAEIVTVDNSLVQKIQFDKTTGQRTRTK